MLRSLSSVGRSKHAIELEKRAANLLIEEGNTCNLIFFFQLRSSFQCYFSSASEMTDSLYESMSSWIDSYFFTPIREGAAEDESSECTGQAFAH